MKPSFGLLSFILIAAAVPITVFIAMNTQNTQQNAYQNSNVLRALTPSAQGNCVPRPRCLDAVPKCELPQPLHGWCAVQNIPTPTPVFKVITTPVLSQPISPAVATASPTAISTPTQLVLPSPTIHQ